MRKAQRIPSTNRQAPTPLAHLANRGKRPQPASIPRHCSLFIIARCMSTIVSWLFIDPFSPPVGTAHALRASAIGSAASGWD